jgi:hypothetical protein
MSENPKPPRHSFGWLVGWFVVVVFVIYPLSVVPVAVSCAWLDHWGIVDLRRPFQVFYWPLEELLNETETGKRVSAYLQPPVERLTPH